jgi:hypothetical protein
LALRDEATGSNGDDVEARLRLLYEETGRVAVVFWEWRHKVILLCSAVLTLAFGGAAWLYNQRLGGGAIAFPLAAGGLIVSACRVFDRRNGEILDDCFQAGAALEDELKQLHSRELPLGIYSRIKASRDVARTPISEASSRQRIYRPPRGSYSRILRWGYAAIGLLLLVLAVASIVLACADPHLLIPAARG